MMSMTAVSGGAAAASYYSTDNYYTAEQATEASVWFGKAAEALGLSGTVDEKVFLDMLEGKLPNGHVIKSPSGEHRAGSDLTFSAPKSVSLMALLGGDKRIEAALRDSVTSAVAWAEENLIETRVWDKSLSQQIPEKTANLVTAIFRHDVNRNGEPQLHNHVVLMNASLASDSKWHAIRNDQLYKNQHLLGAIQNAELRSRIEALGYETTPAHNPIDGAFEIKGVSRAVIEAFSTRRTEIVEHLAADDRSSPREREIAALATRNSKQPALAPEQRIAAWLATAERVGFDPTPIVESALSREHKRETVWTRLIEGVRGIGASGKAIVATMGLTPCDGDELVPERDGRLNPQAFAAAQAVASAARELGEHEAAYCRNDLILKSLERYGPLTVKDIEVRIDHLTDQNLLLAGDRLMTTQSAIQLEQRIIALAKKGNESVQPIAAGNDVAARLQEAARNIGLRRLNVGQEQTGVDILQSTNRIHLVQGGAGVGKSAALTPVAAIAREQGMNVIALAHVGRMARAFGEKVGARALTVDGFLGRYERMLSGAVSAERAAEARQSLNGALIMVDEASQIGSDRLARLIFLANQMDVGRLVLAGDVRQLPAIDAGKPFDQLQNRGLATSYISENLRAQSEQMINLNQALEDQDVAGAFAILAPDTREVYTGKVAESAAQLWVQKEPAARADTLLLASGRAMRSAGNAAVQSELLKRGELSDNRRTLTVLDRVTITREGARQLKGYREGHIVEFRTNLTTQGFNRGERGTVNEVKEGKVELIMAHGELRLLDPSRLPRNLAQDAVTIFEPKNIPIYVGDRIRWTETDYERGLMNGDIAHIAAIDGNSVTVSMQDNSLLKLEHGDRALERLDLAYAINVHVAQGMTATHGIIMMSEREKSLNTSQGFLVAVTRIADHATLVVDNARKIERDIKLNIGDKTSALETVASAEVDNKDATKVDRAIPEKTRDYDYSL